MKRVRAIAVIGLAAVPLHYVILKLLHPVMPFVTATGLAW